MWEFARATFVVCNTHTFVFTVSSIDPNIYCDRYLSVIRWPSVALLSWIALCRLCFRPIGYLYFLKHTQNFYSYSRNSIVLHVKLCLNRTLIEIC